MSTINRENKETKHKYSNKQINEQTNKQILPRKVFSESDQDETTNMVKASRVPKTNPDLKNAFIFFSSLLYDDRVERAPITTNNCVSSFDGVQLRE